MLEIELHACDLLLLAALFVGELVVASDYNLQQVVAWKLYEEQKPIRIQQYVPRQIACESAYDIIDDIKEESQHCRIGWNVVGVVGLYVIILRSSVWVRTCV